MTNHPIDAWTKKAEADLAACRKLAEDDVSGMADVICFHAQQCAEKYLKAFLNKMKRDAPKIHSLKVLVELAKESDPEFETLLEDAAQLEEYAVEFRYPDESATEEEARDALRRAAGIREFVRLKI
ncbi:MAG: HEPN domain-containing protein [Deltaproteobacteria bacterium]|nr:HEPN domain-containing protein [Deltaproteobacteria bacterium]